MKYIYEVCFKNKVFFFGKVVIGLKMKIKGVIGEIKVKKIILKNENSKNISKTFSGAVADSVESVIFR